MVLLKLGQQHREERPAQAHRQDFALTFATGQVPASTGQLRAAYNQLNQRLQQLSRQKEARHLYLQRVLALVQTGILSTPVDILPLFYL